MALSFFREVEELSPEQKLIEETGQQLLEPKEEPVTVNRLPVCTESAKAKDAKQWRRWEIMSFSMSRCIDDECHF